MGYDNIAKKVDTMVVVDSQQSWSDVGLWFARKGGHVR